ncbi:MAG TPA: glycosyltransferase family 4 protein [Stellaceae bacterium]|jgi:glycosyltransferase involved in cell wall biosynthesis
MRPKLLFLITEDWFFYGARLTLARAARDAGFDVVVATRVRDHGERIRAEGFALRPLSWRRRGDGPVETMRVIAEIARLYRAERPDIVHHAALKAIVFGALALRLAFPSGKDAPARIAAVMGLGAVFGRVGARPLRRLHPLAVAVRLAMGRGRVTVENPDNRETLARLGVDPARITVIRGTGVDAGRFLPLPEPQGAGMTMALVGRMLRSKGVFDAAAATRALRGRGLDVMLLLAGGTDPDNPDSLNEAELRALGAEPGIEWLGRVPDVRTVWARAQIAVFPSTYGEGVPTALLEAAACSRPIIAADMPGCREISRPGETGLLVPPGEVGALADAIAELAGDPVRREAMGRAGRELVTREFTDAIVAERTLALYRTALWERQTNR